VTGGALYFHFDSKEQLAAAVLELEDDIWPALAMAVRVRERSGLWGLVEVRSLTRGQKPGAATARHPCVPAARTSRATAWSSCRTRSLTSSEAASTARTAFSRRHVKGAAKSGCGHVGQVACPLRGQHVRPSAAQTVDAEAPAQGMTDFGVRHYGVSPSGALTAFEGSTDPSNRASGVRGAAMQALYAVSFDIRTAQEQPGHVYERLRDHLAGWLSHGGRIPAPSVTEFDQDGRTVLAGRPPGYGDRTVS
jgi:AcrR family transcriptional regulator